MKKVVLGFAVLLASCAPPAGAPSVAIPPVVPPLAGPTHVYATGESAAGQAWWKDGVKTLLPADCFTAKAIATDGADVYVGGVNTSYQPAVWKNGVRTDLPMTATHNGGQVTALALVAGVLYAVGSDTVNGALSAPRLWKDGLAQTLTFDTIGQANSVFVRGSDVYVGGFQISTKTGHYEVATVWKNGAPTALTDGTHDEIAYGVFADASHVWVAGTVGADPVVWKDGVAQTQPVVDNAYSGEVRGVWVQGGHVYAGGRYRNTAKLWTDGVRTDLTTTAAPGSEIVYAVVGDGTDVYVLGDDNAKGPGTWKNGTFQAVAGATFLYGLAVN